MPEFEEENINAPTSENYTPSTDASAKPRTRRRSGGFKAELAPIKNTQVGEVSAAEALKEEKLSGQILTTREQKSVQSEPTAGSKRQKQALNNHRKTNPQPSARTLQAITVVESRVAERQSKRDKKHGSKPDRKFQTKRRKSKSHKEHSREGLLVMIGGWISKLFGNNPKSAEKIGGRRRGQGRGGRRRSKGGNRNAQGRVRGNNKAAKGRKRGSSGRDSRKHTNNAVS